MSSKKRIKVRIKQRQGDEEDIFLLMKRCRENEVIVRGKAENLRKVLHRKIHGVYPKEKQSPEHIIYDTYCKYFLWKLGDGHLVADSSNTHDFSTDQKVSRIPKVYLFCVRDEAHVHAFDIRSLNEYYNACTGTFHNPYTIKPFDGNVKKSLLRKVEWLERLGYHTGHHGSSEIMTPEQKMKNHVVDVFHHISMHQYVDHEWFNKLSFMELKKLYYELHDLWSYRLELQEEEKRKIVKGGVVFGNWVMVEKYKASMMNKLRHELLINIDRLVTEGIDDSYRKSGSLYFMLGFVQISQDAADNHPSLFQAVYVDEE